MTKRFYRHHCLHKAVKIITSVLALVCLSVCLSVRSIGARNFYLGAIARGIWGRKSYNGVQGSPQKLKQLEDIVYRFWSRNDQNIENFALTSCMFHFGGKATFWGLSPYPMPVVAPVWLSVCLSANRTTRKVFLPFSSNLASVIGSIIFKFQQFWTFYKVAPSGEFVENTLFLFTFTCFSNGACLLYIVHICLAEVCGLLTTFSPRMLLVIV